MLAAFCFCTSLLQLISDVLLLFVFEHEVSQAVMDKVGYSCLSLNRKFLKRSWTRLDTLVCP